MAIDIQNNQPQQVQPSLEYNLDIQQFNDNIFKFQLASREAILEALPGNYKIEQFLGKGDFGSVYQARETANSTHKVAIKFYTKYGDQCIKRYDQLKQLHDLAPSLALPILEQGVMTIDEPGFHHPINYSVTSFFGKSLQEAFGNQNHPQMSFSNVLTVFRKILDLYKKLNEHKLSARDCKPSNIFINNFLDVKINDVLVGKQGKANSSFFSERHYRSPYEYLHKHTKSETSFALGATFYFILTGKVLFDVERDGEENEIKNIARHVNSVFSFTGIPSQLLAKNLNMKFSHQLFDYNPNTKTYHLKMVDDEELPSQEEQKEEVLEEIKESLTSGRFQNTPTDSEALANEFFDLIMGLVTVVRPWTADKTLSSKFMKRTVPDPLEQVKLEEDPIQAEEDSIEMDDDDAPAEEIKIEETSHQNVLA